MSSTIDARHERGQILVLFAGGLVTLMLVAALAFDVGVMLVEKREQQNAADAAALAGARFLPANTARANTRAVEMARQNGYEDGISGATVTITFGSWSPQTGFVPGGGKNAIRVEIGRGQASVFAGVIGRSSWDVSASGVGVNQSTTAGPFALLTLHPTRCKSMLIEGDGTVTAYGNIQVNSNCTNSDGAFRVGGNAVLDLLAPDVGCNVVGGWSTSGKATLHDCNPPTTGAPAIVDPYASLPHPPKPLGLPAAMRRWDLATNTPHATNTPPPNGCPGSSVPATEAAPALCDFGGAYKDQAWRVYPGYYPGGINFGGPATFLLEPGLYWIGGGGFRVANAALRTVDAGGLTLGGGVLIFNGTHPLVTPGKVRLEGGTAQVQLWPLSDSGSLADYDRFVIFQDRSITLDVEIHGGGTNTEVRGIIYAPSANVFVQGNAGTLIVDQIIASSIEVRGGGGTINVAYDPAFLPTLRYAGLVE